MTFSKLFPKLFYPVARYFFPPISVKTHSMPNIDQQTSGPFDWTHLRIAVIAAAVIIASITGIGGIYGIGGLMRNAQAQAVCAPALDLAKKIAPLAKGEVAALTMAASPRQIPDLAFNDSDGKPRQLSEWKGRTVLLNLWATWCVPCRKEMPALDRLQKTLGSKDFEVVAINIDTRDPDKPKNFLKDGNLTGLAYFYDDKALGMPTSVIIDGAGCEIANIAGPAEWASDDAVTLLKAATAK
jgi:thiol-disulfide isomerase/thioredoxin